MLLLCLVGLHFWFPRVGGGVWTDSYSAEPEGRKVLYLLAERMLGAARRNHTSLARFDEDHDDVQVLCILGPQRMPDADEWRAILDWVDRGHTLIVAAPHADPEFQLDGEEISVKSITEVKAEGPVATGVASGGVSTGLIETGQVRCASRGEVVGDDFDSLLEIQGKTVVAAWSYGEGSLIVCATDSLFTNTSLAWGDNAELVYALWQMSEEQPAVLFDESLNDTGTPKVVGILLDPPLRTVTLQLAVLLTVFGWCGLARFGPRLPPAVTTLRNVAAHTDALGAMYYRARAGSHVLGSYLNQLRLEWRLKPGAAQRPAQLGAVAGKVKADPAAVGQLLQAAEKAQGEKNLDRGSAAMLIRRLAVLRRGRSGQ